MSEWRMTIRDWQDFGRQWGYNGTSYYVGKWGYAIDQDRLYNHAAFAAYFYHWLLSPGNSRWECDDYHVGDLVISGKFLFVKIMVHRLLITRQTNLSSLQYIQK